MVEISFKNPSRILDLFQKSWRFLQDFENISNNLGGTRNTGGTDGLRSNGYIIGKKYKRVKYVCPYCGNKAFLDPNIYGIFK